MYFKKPSSVAVLGKCPAMDLPVPCVICPSALQWIGTAEVEVTPHTNNQWRKWKGHNVERCRINFSG